MQEKETETLLTFDVVNLESNLQSDIKEAYSVYGFSEDEVRLAGVVRREREVRGNLYDDRIYYTAELRW